MNDELFLLELYGRLPYNPKVYYQGKVYTLKLISNEGILLNKSVYLYKEDGKLLSELVKVHNIKPLLYPIEKVLELKCGANDKSLIDIILGIMDYDGYSGYYTTWEQNTNNKISIYTWGIYLGILDLNTMLLDTTKSGNFQLRSDMWANIQRLLYKHHIDYLGLIKDGKALDIRDYSNEKG